jgi:hypothetical protein
MSRLWFMASSAPLVGISLALLIAQKVIDYEMNEWIAAITRHMTPDQMTLAREWTGREADETD